MEVAAPGSGGRLARTFVEITRLYLDGVLHLQHKALGSVLYLPVMVAGK
jgi:hypothetical protein